MNARIAILGNNSRPQVAWNGENLTTLRGLGFNTLQLNIAWGPRPDDEPLNLEDVVELTPEQTQEYPQPVPLNSNPSPEARARRRRHLTERIALTREHGFRNIFHFGAPFNAHQKYGDNPPNCLSDPTVGRRHELLIEKLAQEFPGIDDLQVYTYDQDAWLCSEFGACPRCAGVPLHERVVPFLEPLRNQWVSINPDGRLWWEPWELSPGQVYHALNHIDPRSFGLMLHNNAAEVMVALPVDRFVRNAAALAQARGIPLVIEGFFGGATEEVEPFTYLQSPLTTLRQVRAMAAVQEGVGLKEYYGLLPDQEDPNLRATGLFFHHSAITDDEALRELARLYAPEEENIARFWRLTSDAMELFPWDASWWIRCIGKSDPRHAMSAAYIRGQQAHTPSWESIRRAIFMKCDNLEPDPWMLEDVQLRAQLTVDRLAAALDLGRALAPALAAPVRETFLRCLADTNEFRRRVLAYVCHLRATNLAAMIRAALERGESAAAKMVRELTTVLEQDLENMQTADPLAPALDLLRQDPAAFVATYLLPDRNRTFSKGDYSATSR